MILLDGAAVDELGALAFQAVAIAAFLGVVLGAVIAPNDGRRPWWRR